VPLAGLATPALAVPTGGKVLLWFYIAFIADATAEGDFQLLENGVAIPGFTSATPDGTNAGCASIALERTPAAAGSYTYSVQWKSKSGTVLTCDPTTGTNMGASITGAVVTV